MRQTVVPATLQAMAGSIDAIKTKREEILKIEKNLEKEIGKLQRAAGKKVHALMRDIGKEYGAVWRFCTRHRESLTSGWKRKFAYIHEHLVKWRDRDTLWFEGNDGEKRALEFLKQEVAKDPNSKFAKLLRWTPEISRTAMRENLELAREVPGFEDLLQRESFAIVHGRRHEQLCKDPFTRELEFVPLRGKKK